MPRIDKQAALQALAEQREAMGLDSEDCMMCALAAGRGAPRPIYETEEMVVLLDRFGSRRGHLLLILKQHIEHLGEVGMETYLRCQTLAYQTARALESALSPTRLFIAQFGAPKSLPMTFPHFHIHVIPLFETDESTRPARVFSWSDGVYVYEEPDAEQLAGELTEALARVLAGPARELQSLEAQSREVRQG